jgi:hypothetical protein
LKNRKQQFRFSVDMDEVLLQETLAHNPFVAEFGHVGATWAQVAESLNVGIDGRRCRERVSTLVKNHNSREAASEKQSGVDEDVSEFDRMLSDITSLMETSQETTKDKRQERVDSAAEAERRGEEMRQQALDGMQYKARKRGREEEELLAFFQERDRAARATKEKEMEVAERKLLLKERELQVIEEKARLDVEERRAVIGLLASLAAKFSA